MRNDMKPESIINFEILQKKKISFYHIVYRKFPRKKPLNRLHYFVMLSIINFHTV